MKKWLFRIFVTLVFISGLLLLIVLQPILAYANKTTHGNFIIYHDQPLNPLLISILDEANESLAKSELYSLDLKIDVCLNDGSWYPDLIRRIRGRAFAWGFYDKVVLQGNANYQMKYVELDGYKWNFPQLIAHEAVHCYQFEKFGFWNSNPVAGIPEWKWEGYPEYIARQDTDQKNLSANINLLVKTNSTENNNWILFSDSTGTVIPYYEYWLLVQYCMNVKKMSYEEILNDTFSEVTLREKMQTHFY